MIDGNISVYLCGSTSTKSRHLNSDIDIVVFSKYPLSNSKKEKIKEQILTEISESGHMDISYYTLDNLSHMIKEGSLFLWHIKLEGKLLFGKDLKIYFDEIVEFRHYEEDILIYTDILMKVKQSIESNKLNLFDLKVLSLLYRNSLILMSNRFGNKKFGTGEVFEDCSNILKKQNLNKQLYLELQQLKSFYKYGGSQPIISYNINEYYGEVEKLIEELLNRFSLNSDLKICMYRYKYPFQENTYSSFELSLLFERGIYFTMLNYSNSNFSTLISLPDFEKKYEEVYVKGIELLVNNKVYRKMGSNYDSQTIEFMNKRYHNNFKELENIDSNLKYFKKMSTFLKNIKLKKISTKLDFYIENFTKTKNLLEIEMKYLYELELFIKKFN